MMVCLGGASKEIDRLIKDCVVDDKDDLPVREYRLLYIGFGKIIVAKLQEDV